MRLPLEIKVRGMELSAAAVDEIRDRVAKLDQFHPKIMRCRVTVEGGGRHHRNGRCKVSLTLTVPGSEIVISRQEGEDLGEALHETFNAAARRLEDGVRRRRGYVKKTAAATPAFF